MIVSTPAASTGGGDTLDLLITVTEPGTKKPVRGLPVRVVGVDVEALVDPVQAGGGSTSTGGAGSITASSAGTRRPTTTSPMTASTAAPSAAT